jgi:hypothetical protein
MIGVNQTRTCRNERHENTRICWAREDLNLQPDRYGRTAAPLCYRCALNCGTLARERFNAD